MTRGQLDIRLAQETGHSGAEWQLGLFVKIEGFVERDALEWAISRVVREAEPVRAAFSESDGQVLQSAIDYPDVELSFFDLSGSRQPVQEARWERIPPGCGRGGRIRICTPATARPRPERVGKRVIVGRVGDRLLGGA